ncbi:hypothetical protein JX265_008380 [Neoarthrinium moseri]|uniref:Uncharacterized protein n=1 Tax=Neoarthrinium moseri TaxID=1658444 RepID=A0A9P9WI56_9PEZI|nr:uncharacterized protein JN550_011302 [Neoarthrinium moseri]KAI1845036.1 hypothetical protein JX266_008829 [Neoarthrinium moseri]KAI1860701.1 hypothetical protein JN550_011302 [Neoarthrinium moseri]KAI1864656.1 hypothetical protein JX265_008380 [Neoarthrinium moseri]
MQFFALFTAIVAALPIAMAAPAKNQNSVPASSVSGGRVTAGGANCSPVQGRLVCDDGFGNTFFADDPFSS